MAEAKNGTQLISFEMKRVFPEVPLPGDLYLFINGKFLKLRNAGDPLENKKYELFLYKKIQYVFIESSDQEKFNSWSEKLSEEEKDALTEAVGLENIDIVEQHLEIKSEVLSFVTKEVTEENVSAVLAQTKNFVEATQEKQLTERFMSQLLSYGQSAADHSTNVANLASYLAISLGFDQSQMLENIYVGALLHDYGKTRISPKYLENPGSDVYKKAMRKHPALGKTALLLDSGFPDDVLRIIAEHHERHDGKGYPRGLKANRIHDLSKIVGIANYFDNMVMKGEGDIHNRQQKALDILRQDSNRIFDAKILSECITALEAVF